MKLKSKILIQPKIEDNLILNSIESISSSQLNRILKEYDEFINLINAYTKSKIEFNPSIEFISALNLTYRRSIEKHDNKENIYLEIDKEDQINQFYK